MSYPHFLWKSMGIDREILGNNIHFRFVFSYLILFPPRNSHLSEYYSPFIMVRINSHYLCYSTRFTRLIIVTIIFILFINIIIHLLVKN
jgi:hypothetical protein